MPKRLAIVLLIAAAMVSTATVTTTTTAAEAQSSNSRGKGPCPEGYNIQNGKCVAEPTVGCGSAQQVPNEDLCIVGLILGSNIPFSDEDPCGVGEGEPGVTYIYPHPFESGTNVCAMAMPLGLICPGEDYHISDGDTASNTINPETGLCEHGKPGNRNGHLEKVEVYCFTYTNEQTGESGIEQCADTLADCQEQEAETAVPGEFAIEKSCKQHNARV